MIVRKFLQMLRMSKVKIIPGTDGRQQECIQGTILEAPIFRIIKNINIVFDYSVHRKVLKLIRRHSLFENDSDINFCQRLNANAYFIHQLYQHFYGHLPNADSEFYNLLETIVQGHVNRKDDLRNRDEEKIADVPWFLSNELMGMSLYVDRFAGNLKALEEKLDYFPELGINVLHLMPLFQSPPDESDGGYAVSDFKKIDPRFGTMDDLLSVQRSMLDKQMYLMVDMVYNHTSDQQEWAMRAKAGEKEYQDYFFMFDDRTIPDEYEKTMKEIFPAAAPGNFTWVEECNKWVMTVFHHYQWDLNYSNPKVFIAMLGIVYFYANLGVDILRIDAPAFVWKQIGTTCSNLPDTHKLLQLLKLCVSAATPGMALLGEAIQRPRQIMEYFGDGIFRGHECDFLYKAPQMALQWDALATRDTRVMLAQQEVLLDKPYGTSWITYTRCHDDIGLGYDDEAIAAAGYEPFTHRRFIRDYYSGKYFNSPSRGDLFSFNPRTGDARISGSLASLCGLEKALEESDEEATEMSIRKIIMMQAFSFFVGGLPMLFYGDEIGYMNSQEYLREPGKSYDNRWMHRPMISWDKNAMKDVAGTIENRIYTAIKNLIAIRKSLPAIADYSNLEWSMAHNIHVAVFHRYTSGQEIVCAFNFSPEPAFLTWYAFREHGRSPEKLYDHITGQEYQPGPDEDYLILDPYRFHVMEKT